MHEISEKAEHISGGLNVWGSDLEEFLAHEPNMDKAFLAYPKRFDDEATPEFIVSWMPFVHVYHNTDTSWPDKQGVYARPLSSAPFFCRRRGYVVAEDGCTTTSFSIPNVLFCVESIPEDPHGDVYQCTETLWVPPADSTSSAGEVAEPTLPSAKRAKRSASE